jgi:hypothetical protein
MSPKRYGFGGATCEDYHAIDVRDYARKGLLKPDTWGWTKWSRDDEETGSISFVAGDGCITLKYRVRAHGGDWESVEQRVPLDYTSPPYGGRRPWFLCPRCWRRCAKLYGGARFYCRKCWGLTYQSQREDRSDRLMRRARAIRMRLGGSADMTEFFPPKPKRMHWRTYSRLYQEAKTLENAMNYAILVRFRRYWG